MCDKTISADESVIKPATVISNRGVLVDAELTMQQHVSRQTRACFFQILRLRSVRKQFGHQVTAQFVPVLVLLWLDYCNVVLVDLPSSTLAPLQQALHAAARLGLELGPRDHILAALHELHWLPIRKRIQNDLRLLAHNVQIGSTQEYMSRLLTATANVPSKTPALLVTTRLRLVDRTFPLLLLVLGMFCRQN